MMDTLLSIIPWSLSYTAPLLIIALGGLYSERSGVVNIGLEGLMGIGAFSSALFIVMSQGVFGAWTLWLALIVGMLAGVALSFFHALASVTMKSNQVISGTAINMFSAAFSVYLARALTGSANIPLRTTFTRVSIPVLREIPILGPLFFNSVYYTTYIVLALVIGSYFLLYKTRFGLRLRACGENPHAADSMGVNVTKMRYIGVLFSGALAGLGGSIVILTYAKEFSQNIYSGLGFLALAALIFGKWKPFGILASSLFFGIALTIANLSSVLDSFQNVPDIFLNTFPYVATLVALVLFSSQSAGPKAAGEPYDVGKR